MVSRVTVAGTLSGGRKTEAYKARPFLPQDAMPNVSDIYAHGLPGNFLLGNKKKQAGPLGQLMRNWMEGWRLTLLPSSGTTSSFMEGVWTARWGSGPWNIE